MEQKPLSFFKTMLASGLGMLIVGVITTILAFIIMIGTITSMAVSGKTSSPVKNNTFLKIDLTQHLSERQPSDLQQLLANEGSMGLIQILKALDYAKTDDKILGVYLYMGSGTMQSWGQSEELRLALESFKQSGKPIVSYADSYSQTGYYVATAADHLLMGSAGQVDLRGIAAQPMFYKDLLDKWDIHMDLIRPRNNAYKSAGEAYTMNHMSEANREQIRTYITSIWNYVSQQIAQARSLTQAQVNNLADNLTGYMAEQAVQQQLIDTLCFEHSAMALMEQKYAMKQLKDVDDYANNIIYTNNSNKIAIIYAEGDVVTGTNTGMKTAVYGDEIAKAFDDAAKDNSIKAIVLRVNSPGGAVLASETMTAAVMRAKEKKPVVVSMSDVAASAGYEISCNATKIVALPTTLTGSIGVFAAIPEVGTALKKHLGITTDTVMTNKNASGVNGMRPMSPKTREIMQQDIEDFYKTFIGRVAYGRNMKVEDVDAIARGRVWTGADAIKIGLVDTLGSLATAISIAAEEAQVGSFALVEFPKQKDLMTQLVEITGGKIEENKMSAIPFAQELIRWTNMEPMQARLPYILNIE